MHVGSYQKGYAVLNVFYTAFSFFFLFPYVHFIIMEWKLQDDNSLRRQIHGLNNNENSLVTRTSR